MAGPRGCSQDACALSSVRVHVVNATPRTRSARRSDGGRSGVTVWRCFLVASRSMSRISSISRVNGSSFDGRAEPVVVRGCGQAEVSALLTVLQVTPYLHCNARFDMPSRKSRGLRRTAGSVVAGPWVKSCSDAIRCTGLRLRRRSGGGRRRAAGRQPIRSLPPRLWPPATDTPSVPTPNDDHNWPQPSCHRAPTTPPAGGEILRGSGPFLRSRNPLAQPGVNAAERRPGHCRGMAREAMGRLRVDPEFDVIAGC